MGILIFEWLQVFGNRRICTCVCGAGNADDSVVNRSTHSQTTTSALPERLRYQEEERINFRGRRTRPCRDYC